MRKLGPLTELPILCYVFDTDGDFKARTLLCVSLCLASSAQAAASPGMWMLSAAQDPVLLPLPSSDTCQKITLETQAPVSMVTWRSMCFLPLHWALGGGNPQDFLCKSEFSGMGLKKLHPDLTSFIKSPVKPLELQSVNKDRTWLYVDVLTTELWNDVLPLASDLLPTQRNSRVR